MPKFFQKNGLTEYALACGYIQTVKLNGVEVQLYKDGCYHVRTFDKENGRLWECFDSLANARKYWERQVKKSFSNALNLIKTDKRYTYALEYCGEAGQQYIVRFCGQYVARSETIYGAKIIAYKVKTV